MKQNVTRRHFLAMAGAAALGAGVAEGMALRLVAKATKTQVIA